MSRLIDADDFKIDVDERGLDFFISETDLDNAKKMIDEQKTVDAVTVVRCRECKYARHWYSDRYLCDRWSEIGIEVRENGYCADGEREEKKQ